MRDKKKQSKLYLGRDISMGRVCFSTGVRLTRKDKLRCRNSKHARNELRRQLDNR